MAAQICGQLLWRRRLGGVTKWQRRNCVATKWRRNQMAAPNRRRQIDGGSKRGPDGKLEKDNGTNRNYTGMLALGSKAGK